MRWLTLILFAVLLLLQYPLWLGKGGWLRVWDVDRQLQGQKENNRQLEIRNAGLDAEVRDLKQGYEAIEERARYELGMVKQDEVFVQIPEKGSAPKTAKPETDKPEAAVESPRRTASPTTPAATPPRSGR